MCSLPFFMIERCFATFYISDYEFNERRKISLLLVTLQIIVGLSSSILLRDEFLTRYVVAVLMTFNIAALALKKFLEIWNHRVFTSHAKKFDSRYSLATRYQVSENIKALNMITNVVQFQSLMNIILFLSVLLTSLNISQEFNLLSTFLLDLFIFIYSFALPQIMTKYCEKWRFHTQKMLQSFGILSKTITPLRDSFGMEMSVNPTMIEHFDQLKIYWGEN